MDQFKRYLVLLLTTLLALTAGPVSRAAAAPGPSSVTGSSAATGPSPVIGSSAASGPSAGSVTSGGIDRVSADAGTITVSGALPAELDPAVTAIDVYELDPTAPAGGFASAQPVATLAAPRPGPAYTVSFPRLDGARDRGYAKYLAVARTAAGASPLGNPHYVDDVRGASRNDYPFPQIADKKGLQVEMTDDAERLGVRHAAINVAFDSLMQLRDAGPDATLTYQADGRPFYFSRSYVRQLDSQIKAVSDNGTLVNLICILYRNTGGNSAFPVLVHPDADLGKGTVYAFNTKTAEGLEHFKAAMEFLADRYTRADQRYGRALGYIVGNEVDSAYVWSNMGNQTLTDFTEYYLRALRVAWQATRKAYTYPRVYTSLDHQWTVPYDPGRPLQSYQGKDIVDTLTALSRTEGDFPWHIAYHPYPQDLTNPAFWKDTQATGDPDSTPLITFKNIEVLPEYLRRAENAYQGEPRRVILSEQGCNTSSDTDAAQRLQAACFAYAYYKVRFTDGIDSLILHRHVDHQGEGGLRLGLWGWDAGRAESAMPGERKYAYDVFRYIDTARSLAVTAFALPIIGIDDWSEAVPGFDPAALDQRDEPRPVGTRVDGVPVQPRTLAGFDTDAGGWQPSDNANAVQVTSDAPYSGTGALRVHFDSGLPAWSTDAKTAKAANVFLPSSVDASQTPQLTLAVRVPPPAPGRFRPDNTFHAEVTVYTAGGAAAQGTARLDPARGWQRLALDLSTWDGRAAVTRIKVAVRGTSNDTWAGTFDLDDVALARSVAPATDRRNIDVAATTSSRPGPGSAVAFTITDNDATALDEDLEIRGCDGVTLDPATFDVTGVAAAGGTRTLTGTIVDFRPADPGHPRLCARYHGESLDVVVDVLPPRLTVLYGFEDGVEGWTAGQDVGAVAAVAGFANAPGVPYDGAHALDATMTAGDASAPKTVSVIPAAPLHLPTGATLVAWVDAYGGAPGATGYEATLTAYSGTESVAVTTAVQPDRWNQIVADLAGWPYRDTITRIDITFRALGTTAAWSAHFQVDDVGYLS